MPPAIHSLEVETYIQYHVVLTSFAYSEITKFAPLWKLVEGATVILSIYHNALL